MDVPTDEPFLTPNPTLALTDGLKGGADAAAGARQTMEEILARSVPAGPARAAPAEEQSFTTMEEILAAPGPPVRSKQQ